MHAVLFQSHLLTIATDQIHVIVIAFVYKSHSGNQIDLAGNTLKNRLTRNYITSVGQSEIIYPVYDSWEVKNHTLSSGTSLYRPNKEVSPGACWLIHKKQVTFLTFTKRSLFLSYVFEEICFFVQGSLRASSLFGAVARSHTKAARETDDASTWGGWLASLALNGELASRLYDQGIIFTSFLK